jgi:hypothetical protein
MLILPKRIGATIVDETTGSSLGEDILVAFRLLVHGQVYYADLMGLTDQDGNVALTGEQLERQFRDNQEAFPMDSRIPLGDCDPTLRIVVPGGAEFEEMRRQAVDTRWVAPHMRAMYERALNAQWNTTAQQADMSVPGTDALHIAVPLVRLRAE